MAKKKLIVVLSRVPYPLDKGDRLRAFHMLRELSALYKIYLYCMSDEPVSFQVREQMLEFCEEFHAFVMNQSTSWWKASKALLFSRWPMQVAFFYNKSWHQKILEDARRIAPDHVLFQLVRMAPYREGLQHPSVCIDYMDVFSVGYKRLSDRAPKPLSWLYRIEAIRLRNYEQFVFNRFHKHFIISEQDRLLMDYAERSQIAVIRNGVDSVYYSPTDHLKKYDLLFHGNMNYAPNIECALYLAHEILPALNQRGRDFNLLISGARPARKVQSLQSDRITVTGWLDDVRVSYNSSRIFVAPLRMGTGVQNKILEAMAMGVPCVVSPMAARALDLIHLEHVLIADSTNAYCDCVLQLYDHPEMARQLAASALAFVKQKFVWKDTVHQLFLTLESSAL